MIYMEVVFDIGYLLIIFLLGVLLLKKDNKLAKIFGLMALVLGFGDMFHLIPRVVGHLTTGLDDYTMWLGLGSAITSVTMTVFYFLLLKAYELQFGVNKRFRYIVVTLLIIKFFITFMPQNRWLTNDATYLFGIIRNAPFMLMGFIMIFELIRQKNPMFTKIAYGVLVSFLFYMVVIFGAHFVPALGAMMMPKTIAYVYVMYIAYKGV